MSEIKKSSKKHSNNKDNSQIIKILNKREAFSGTLHDAEILDGEYCLFVLGNEKFETITYLRECFYGENATTGRIQRIHKSS